MILGSLLYRYSVTINMLLMWIAFLPIAMGGMPKSPISNVMMRSSGTGGSNGGVLGGIGGESNGIPGNPDINIVPPQNPRNLGTRPTPGNSPPRILFPPRVPFRCTLFPTSGHLCPYGYPRPSAKYYYDPYSQKCEAFYFLGCGDTPNKFSTKAACLRGCACFSDIDFGNSCPNNPFNYVIRYAFDQLSGTCQQFHFSACSGGNDNNFRSQLDCQNTCGPTTDSSFPINMIPILKREITLTPPSNSIVQPQSNNSPINRQPQGNTPPLNVQPQSNISPMNIQRQFNMASMDVQSQGNIPFNVQPQGNTPSMNVQPQGNMALVNVQRQANMAPINVESQGNMIPLNTQPRGNMVPSNVQPQGNTPPINLQPQGNISPMNIQRQANMAPMNVQSQGNMIPLNVQPQANMIPINIRQGNVAPMNAQPQGNMARVNLPLQDNLAPLNMPSGSQMNFGSSAIMAIEGSSPSLRRRIIMKSPASEFNFGSSSITAGNSPGSGRINTMPSPVNMLMSSIMGTARTSSSETGTGMPIRGISGIKNNMYK